MDKIPMIGISGSIEHDESKQFIIRDYMTAIIAAGGIPLLLSVDMQDNQLNSCLSHMSGILLAGGNDVDPQLFQVHPKVGLGQVDPLRDQFEVRLINACHRLHMPMLAICRGVQIMNAALGGSLYQDIEKEYEAATQVPPILHHQTAPAKHPSHEVHVDQKSKLFQFIKETDMNVNSFHHQAIKDISPALRIACVAPDGVVEAVEDASLPFFLGVQWHPERMYHHDKHALALFTTFIRFAVAYGNEGL